ncbi:MAG: TonB-dependent receptor [Verrucomicrobiales bacterium]|nr:TonB-dependent receptor [Verrucomicrobiales bacterium]
MFPPLILAISPTMVFAQAGLEPSMEAAAGAELLPPMIVTASRTALEPQDLPYSASVVGATAFEERLPRTTVEALRELPSIMLQKTGHGQGSPFLRGFTGFRTLMLIDGIRLNNSTFRDGPNQYWSTVDAFSLSRMEVVRGPGSVLYGSDAIGGTVQAFTRGRESFDPGWHADGRAFYRFASAESSHTGRGEFSANGGETVGLHAGLTMKEYGDLRGGEDLGLMPRTGYSEWDADAKVRWRPNDFSEVVFGHQTVDLDDAWRTHATVQGKSWEGATVGRDFTRIFDQLRDLNYVQYQARDLDGFVDEVRASLSYQVQGEKETRWRSDLRRDEQTVDVGTLGAWVQALSTTSVGEWVYGAEFYHDWVDSTFRRYASTGELQSQRRQGPVTDDGGYDLFGAYVQDRIPLWNERLELTLGGRINQAHADAGAAEDPFTAAPLSFEDSWSTAVGSGRFLWRVDADRRWVVFGGVSQGFRAPNFSDLTRFDIARSGEQEVPALDLSPEHFISFEGGVKTHHGRFGLEASFFHTLIDEMIVRVPTGLATPAGAAIVTKQNSGDGYVHGVELDASVDLGAGFGLWGNLTWMEGRVETPLSPGGPILEEPVTRIMPATVNAGIRWEAEDRRFWAEFATTVARTQDLLSSGDARDTDRIPSGGTPGYEVYHLRAGWRPCAKATLSLALENLANADYRVHGSGLNEPGRNLIVACDVRF